jgi:TolB-like protein/tetratricopeptide (TPR) repeat protein
VVVAVVAVGFALRPRGSAPDLPHDASLVVLPFVERADASAGGFLGVGLAEDLANRLARVEGLRLTPHSSALRFARTTLAPEAVAESLGVSHVLTGTVSVRTDTVRISVELVDAANRRRQWGEAHTVALRDLAATVDSMARSVTQSLTPGGMVARAGAMTRDSLAYWYYLLGQHHFNRFTPDELIRASAYYDSAIARDPAFVDAWMGRGSVLMARASGNGNLTGRDALSGMRQALDTVLAIDPQSAPARALRAQIYTWYEWDWAAAARESRLALARGRGDPTVLVRSSFLHIVQGQADTALTLLDAARRLDPTNPRVGAARANAAFFARRYAAALEYARNARVVESSFPPNIQFEAMSLGMLRRHGEAIALMRSTVAANPLPLMVSTLGVVLALADSVAAARDVVRTLESLYQSGRVDAGLILRPLAAMGDGDGAFSWLDRAIVDRSYIVSFLRADPLMDPLRSDPRFEEALARAGLPPLPSPGASAPRP